MENSIKLFHFTYPQTRNLTLILSHGCPILNLATYIPSIFYSNCSDKTDILLFFIQFIGIYFPFIRLNITAIGTPYNSETFL